MDPEFRRYLRAILILLGLIVGFQATELLVSAVSMSMTFFVIPLIGGMLVAGAVWVLAGALD